MARIGLISRLAKLENRRRKQSPNRVLHYNPADLGEGPPSPDLPVWALGLWRQDENPACGPLRAFSGRFALMPDFGTAEEWEAAAEKQQKQLLAVARSRTNTPVEPNSASVGNGFKDDAPAPKRKGTKGQRFIELADGRTFDTESRQYVDDDGKPTAKAGGLSVEWKR